MKYEGKKHPSYVVRRYNKCLAGKQGLIKQASLSESMEVEKLPR